MFRNALRRLSHGMSPLKTFLKNMAFNKTLMELYSTAHCVLVAPKETYYCTCENKTTSDTQNTVIEYRLELSIKRVSVLLPSLSNTVDVKNPKTQGGGNKSTH